MEIILGLNDLWSEGRPPNFNKFVVQSCIVNC